MPIWAEVLKGLFLLASRVVGFIYEGMCVTYLLMLRGVFTWNPFRLRI